MSESQEAADPYEAVTSLLRWAISNGTSPYDENAVYRAFLTWRGSLLSRLSEKETAEKAARLLHEQHHRTMLKLDAALSEAREERDRQTAYRERVEELSLQRAARIEELEAALREIQNELGVPDRSYPAPVANAVAIARRALSPVQSPEEENL